MERERDEELSAERCFRWLNDWRTYPTHTIAGMSELFGQLLPTRLYTIHKRVVIWHVGCVVQRQRAWPTSYLHLISYVRLRFYFIH